MRTFGFAVFFSALVLWSQEVVLVDFRSPMKYLSNRADPGIGGIWIDPSFDDTQWQEGLYAIGYGAGGMILTEVPAGTLSVYTRARFTLSDPAAVENVFFGVDFDDAYVAWLNGVEIARSGMPAGVPDWDTAPLRQHESSNGTEPSFSLVDVTQVARSALRAGENLVAVGVWNRSASSSDLALAVRLSVNRPQATAGTELCGVLTGQVVLKEADSPYTVTCDVTVPEGSSLRVEPGVTVRCSAGTAVRIEGSIVAEGTAAKPVVFTREGNQRWDGITIDLGGQSSPASSHLSFVEVWYAGAALHVVDSGSARIVLEDCAFDSWSDVAVHWENAPQLVLRRCAFGLRTPEREAHSETIHGYESGATIEYCTFGRRYGYNDVIDLARIDRSRGSFVVVRGCTFLGGDDDAVDFDSADGFIVGNIITNCQYRPGAGGEANGGGITGSGGSRTVVINNLIYNCYHGIGYKDRCDVWILNNTIINCHVGFTLYWEHCGQELSRGHLYNNIIWGVDSDGDGKPLSVVLNGRWWPDYCHEGEIQGTVDIRNCIVQGGWSEGEAVLDQDPQLVDPQGGDFSLSASSPAIDAGFGDIPTIAGVDGDLLAAFLAEDHDGNGRVDIPCVADTGSGWVPYLDIGAFEFQNLGVCGGVVFIRGDANGDGGVDLSDAISILRHLFLQAPTDCEDALDANDDGTLNVGDAVYLLLYLFSTPVPPPAPFPLAGPDPTPDGLECERTPAHR